MRLRNILSIIIAVWALQIQALDVTNTAGNLHQAVTDLNITTLKVTGTMDANDFYFIADNLRRLTTVDLSEVTIVPCRTDQSHYSNYNFDADELPAGTFASMALTSVKLPDGLKRIGKNAFNNCKALPAISIPEGVTHIDESAFNGCFDAAELSLPSTLTNIGAYAFDRCYAMLKVTCHALTPPQMQNSSIFLNDTYNNGTLYVPSTSIEDYRQADYWYRFSNIAAALIPGDVDGDGQVGIADVTALIDYILGNSDSSFIVANADVDGDGNIGIADVTAIIDTLLGN